VTAGMAMAPAVPATALAAGITNKWVPIGPIVPR